MESAERKAPVAIKAGVRLQAAFALIDAGYIQAHQNVTCPLCPIRYLLFIHRKDCKSQGQHPRELRVEITKYLTEMIARDHATGHLHDQVFMPRNASDEAF
jgi:hypothetical protein